MNRSCHPPTTRTGTVIRSRAAPHCSGAQNGSSSCGCSSHLSDDVRLAPEQVTDARRDRQPVEHRAQPPFGRGQAHERWQRPGVLLVSDQVAPADVVVQVEDAVAVRGPAEVVRAYVHDGRDQLRRRVHGQRPLHEPEVAGAVGGQPSLEPALLAQPGDGVLPVRDLVAHRLELPAGPEGTAAALQQHVVAAFGEDLRVLQGERAAAAVRAANQHGGRRRHADRQVVVGQQYRAVGHRHLEIAFDRNPVPLWRQRPCPGQHLAERGRSRAQRAGRDGLLTAHHALLLHHAVLSATMTPAGTVHPALRHPSADHRDDSGAPAEYSTRISKPDISL